MKKVLITTLALVISNFLLSQNYEIDYIYNNVNNSKRIYKLMITDSISIFEESKSINRNEDVKINSKTKYQFLKLKNSGTIYYTDRVFKNVLFVKDSLQSFDWEKLKEEKYILGLKCNSAKTTFRGREYIAFYHEDFEKNDGPWKFSGLPGLILEIQSLDKEYYFTAVGIKISNDLNYNIDFLNQQFLSWKEYTKEFKRLIDNIIKKIKASDKSGGIGYFKFDKLEIIYPEVQTGEGKTF